MTGRLRTAVRAVLVLGMAASVVANVLHAQPTLVARAIGAWSPLALLLTIELVARVPVVRPRLAWPRRAATTAIAGIAGWVSYWHTVAVCERFGESPASAHLIPFSVDGLIVVASVCLVEIGGRTAPVPGESEPVATPDTATDTPPDVDQRTAADLHKHEDRAHPGGVHDPAPKPRPKPHPATGTTVPPAARTVTPSSKPQRTDDEIVAALDRMPEDVVLGASQRTIAAEFGIGTARAKRVLDLYRLRRQPTLTVINS